jgi:hypothetical protein
VFLGTLVAAGSAAAAGDGKAIPTAAGDRVPLWEVHANGEVADYAVCRADAQAMAADKLRALLGKQTIHATTGEFSGNHYRVMQVSWRSYRAAVACASAPDQGGNVRRDARQSALRLVGWDADRLDADVQAYRAQGHAWIHGARPRHALDVPSVLDSGESTVDVADQFGTRASALKAAAEANREILASGDPRELDHWHVVIEIGDVLPGGQVAAISFVGGAAVERFTVHRPLRLVRPTAEEIQEHAAVVA